jgi:hypothetical protein
MPQKALESLLLLASKSHRRILTAPRPDISPFLLLNKGRRLGNRSGTSAVILSLVEMKMDYYAFLNDCEALWGIARAVFSSSNCTFH